jgi:parvulin-like peptidyl-prolyl isomerase
LQKTPDPLQLMEQAAQELNVSVTDEDLDAEMKRLIDEVGGQAAFVRKLAEAQTSKDEWLAVERASMIGRKVLEAITADLPKTAEFVHARQIFCKEQASCDAALARIDGGEDFAAVAKELSEDSSTRDRGGDLDWVTRGSLLSPELEEVVFGLQTGQHSAVVATDLGYHIVEMIERDPGRAAHAASRAQADRVADPAPRRVQDRDPGRGLEGYQRGTGRRQWLIGVPALSARSPEWNCVGWVAGRCVSVARRPGS